MSPSAYVSAIHLKGNSYRTLCNRRASRLGLATEASQVTCDVCKRILAKPASPGAVSPEAASEDAALQRRLDAAATPLMEAAAREGLPVDYTRHRCGALGKPRVELAVYLPPLKRS